MMGPYGSSGSGMGWGGWLAMGFALVVFFGLVAVGVVLLIRSLGSHNEITRGPSGRTASLGILEDRFARGEIDADEYGRRRELLSSS